MGCQGFFVRSDKSGGRPYVAAIQFDFDPHDQFVVLESGLVGEHELGGEMRLMASRGIDLRYLRRQRVCGRRLWCWRCLAAGDGQQQKKEKGEPFRILFTEIWPQ